MSKMLPYQVLMETKGLKKAELPTEVKAKIKKIEATLRAVGSFGKKDENGDYIITNNVRTKLDTLDAEIVNGIWDYLEGKQKEELRTPPQNTEVKKEVAKETVVSKTPTTETTETTTSEATTTTAKEESKGKIGFFDF